MTPAFTYTPLVKIIAAEPLAKIGPAQSYWIRVVPDKRGSSDLYAIAAIRCENREEIQWLSAGIESPAIAVKLMRNGFVPEAENDLACDIVEALLKNRSCVWMEIETSVAA